MLEELVTKSQLKIKEEEVERLKVFHVKLFSHLNLKLSRTAIFARYEKYIY